MPTGNLAIADSTNGDGWDEIEPMSEQRTAPRFTLLIRTAKLIAPEGEFLCVVRDASQHGMKARVFCDIPTGVQLIIEFNNGESYPVTKIWQNGEIAGFRFLEPVAIERLLSDSPESFPKRSVRLRIALPATVTFSGRNFSATFRDISQHGACLHSEVHMPLNARIGLTASILPGLDAHVCWRRSPHYGVIFTQTFRFDELARLTASLVGTEQPPAGF